MRFHAATIGQFGDDTGGLPSIGLDRVITRVWAVRSEQSYSCLDDRHGVGEDPSVAQEDRKVRNVLKLAP